MNDLLNENELAKAVVHAIDNNLRGDARRNYIDAHNATQQLVVDFVRMVGELLNQKFQN